MANRSEETAHSNEARLNIPRLDLLLPGQSSRPNNTSSPMNTNFRRPPVIVGELLSTSEILDFLGMCRRVTQGEGGPIPTRELPPSHYGETLLAAISLSCGSRRRNRQTLTPIREEANGMARSHPYSSIRSQVNNLSTTLENTHIGAAPPQTQPSPRVILRRGNRRPFTMNQILMLEETFRKTKYPNKRQRLDLASSVGLSDYQVMIWFQNRRARANENVESSQLADTDSLDPPPTSLYD